MTSIKSETSVVITSFIIMDFFLKQHSFILIHMHYSTVGNLVKCINKQKTYWIKNALIMSESFKFNFLVVNHWTQQFLSDKWCFVGRSIGSIRTWNVYCPIKLWCFYAEQNETCIGTERTCAAFLVENYDYHYDNDCQDQEEITVHFYNNQYQRSRPPIYTKISRSSEDQGYHHKLWLSRSSEDQGHQPILWLSGSNCSQSHIPTS